MYAKLLFCTLFTASLVTGCKRDDDDDPPVTPPPVVPEESTITSLELHFHSIGDVEHKHFAYNDPDGPGGNAPEIHADTLSVDSVYEAEIVVLNEGTTPIVDLTDVIAADGVTHQVFYQFIGADVVPTYEDTDTNGNPIGMATIWTVGGAGNGNLTVTLRHGPDKGAAGVSDGDITNAGGETDIEVTFPIVIE